MDIKKSNGNLHSAKKEKNDEFYTQLSDIEKELGHYKDHFKGKVVFCNCDDPEESNFWNYFALNFEHLGLKKLVSTHYDRDKPTYKLEIVSDINHDGKINKLDTIKTPLKQNGDFRSPECVEILKEADIVVTNPPFSLFREYVAQLVEFDKKFLIIGNMNAITYKEIFKLIKENKLWLGNNANINGGAMYYEIPEKKANLDQVREIKTDSEGNNVYITRVQGVRWFTNLSHGRQKEKIILFKSYKDNESEFPKYDNYDAINVDFVKNIPVDYEGAMGVPVSFLDKYNPEQFEIIGRADANISNENNIYHIKGFKDKGGAPLVKGRFVYKRILIKNKKQ